VIWAKVIHCNPAGVALAGPVATFCLGTQMEPWCQIEVGRPLERERPMYIGVSLGGIILLILILWLLGVI
jgi:hypothetical protein